MRALRRLWRASVWHPDAIDPDEHAYRNLKRVWLPLYDVIAVAVGITALVFGSRLLDRIFGHPWTDTIGATFLTAATVCLIGVAFPRLWPVEAVAKCVLVGMLIGYIAAIVLFPAEGETNWFVVCMIALALPLPLFRLGLIGEEWKESQARGDAP